jgi:hypothetical protein
MRDGHDTLLQWWRCRVASLDAETVVASACAQFTPQVYPACFARWCFRVAHVSARAADTFRHTRLPVSPCARRRSPLVRSHPAIPVGARPTPSVSRQSIPQPLAAYSGHATMAKPRFAAIDPEGRCLALQFTAT